jgi:hypothetical protein
MELEQREVTEKPREIPSKEEGHLYCWVEKGGDGDRKKAAASSKGSDTQPWKKN